MGESSEPTHPGETVVIPVQGNDGAVEISFDVAADAVLDALDETNDREYFASIALSTAKRGEHPMEAIAEYLRNVA